MVATGVYYLATTNGLRVGTYLWPYVAVALRDTLVLVGPLAVGLSAWAASKERRRGVEELLATTPRPPFARDLARWGAATALICGGYALGAAVLMLRTYLGGAWGSPVVWPVLVSLLALATHSALGYAVGFHVPSRFTAPVVAIIMYWGQGFVGYFLLDSAVRYLSPLGDGDHSVFFGVLPRIPLPQSLWFTGLAGAAIATVALRRDRSSWVSWGALCASATVAALGATMLLATPPQVGSAQRQEAYVRYTPVCAEGRTTVCVHPAYGGMLPEAAAAMERVTKPLIGLPGLPTRAEQRDYLSDPLPEGTLPILLPTPTTVGQDQAVAEEELTAGIALGLVQDTSSSRFVESGGVPDDAQAAVAYWLVDASGSNPQTVAYYGPNPETVTASGKRFAKLSAQQRGDWLAQNFVELRDGRLTLEDLP
jgi:hypothetical protein